jgi:hypothetical protein
MLGAEYRSRLNGLYMATFFLDGAAGSGVEPGRLRGEDGNLPRAQVLPFR